MRARRTWPDKFPRKRPHEHYVNLPRDATELTEPCPMADKCVVSAIMEEITTLSVSNDEDQKLQALKFLDHWVGDVHQPLHVSFEDDRGGNAIKETGPCSNSLHSVWDTCIIRRSLGQDPLEVAADLRSSITDAERQAWTESAVDVETVMRWADESFAVATAPETEYCVRKDDACWYSEDRRSLGMDDEEKTVRVDQDYLSRNAPRVAERLKMAGVRLAATLNHIFSD